ncbi:FMN-binding glutamate synthase family protein [Aneurinibacillus migulanus]|uniref:Glutamate synthase n=1 Tax=Aneurinibacillus migulanus TaxID=47500 RepID=A0A0D1XWU2_ANEMI|nr:FMN-binding glutamate synthase family protein [Aneurinibacillus migulanus]KIV51532.1 glutamate synthase [Aneurinibacillus migulanus]KON97572.1 glutamate synthase [Aneurinibacillus migulanus]MED0894169.1 FMN-binding glutamate synthase family protein [Aneurinibacillus migulanus]MED1619644.1 FMN-binding glutamate synthase family protein [Aneurinibacillus migulanus]SDK11562.1 Glutamate synthase domain-containing protein 2 [Aneurinibacillus migulanus]
MENDDFSLWLGAFTATFTAIVCAGIFTIIFARPLIKLVVGRFTKRLMSERYPENIWEMVTAMTRMNPTMVIENSLRADSGKVIERPFGSPRKFLNFDGLIFSPAQLAVLPAHEKEPVDMKVTIGPKAKRPLTLDIPLMSAALGYGIGVSEKVKIAMAKGTAAVGTATNTGEGGFLPEDRANSKYLILQYNSATWSKNPDILKQADAIEIHIGQGASAGAASFIPPEFLEGRARDVLQVPPGEIVVPARHQEINKPQELKPLVNRLRKMTEGVPIGVKICASAILEADLEVAIQGEVDFISIDGGQAGTKGGPPILEDDFGLPTIYALSRAADYLEKRGVKERVSLLIGGGFFNPGECLKALALGADAVFMGTALIWAMTHSQVTKAVPWEPPTQLVFYPGNMTDEFDEEEAAKYLENFFTSCVEEMKVAIRALGKNSWRQVNKDDLVALDEWTSKVTKVPLAYEPYEPITAGQKCSTKERRKWLSFFQKS